MLRMRLTWWGGHRQRRGCTLGIRGWCLLSTGGLSGLRSCVGESCAGWRASESTNACGDSCFDRGCVMSFKVVAINIYGPPTLPSPVLHPTSPTSTPIAPGARAPTSTPVRLTFHASATGVGGTCVFCGGGASRIENFCACAGPLRLGSPNVVQCITCNWWGAIGFPCIGPSHKFWTSSPPILFPPLISPQTESRPPSRTRSKPKCICCNKELCPELDRHYSKDPTDAQTCASCLHDAMRLARI